jgi:hypothetical protein
LHAFSAEKLQNGIIEGSLTLGIAEVDVGTGLDKEIDNDAFIQSTSRVQ